MHEPGTTRGGASKSAITNTQDSVYVRAWGAPEYRRSNLEYECSTTPVAGATGVTYNVLTSTVYCKYVFYMEKPFFSHQVFLLFVPSQLTILNPQKSVIKLTRVINNIFF